MKYYIDCEFDGHNGPLLSMAIVREDGRSLHIETVMATARDPWVRDNVLPLMMDHQAESMAVVTRNEYGHELREFLRDDPHPVIIADSPVDIARFCQAFMTSKQGEYKPNEWTRMSFEVHDVDCYPTDLPGAVQHNAWWDAMALRHKLTHIPRDLTPTDEAIEAAARAMCDRVNGIGDYDENIDKRRSGWTAQAKAALIAAARQESAA